MHVFTLSYVFFYRKHFPCIQRETILISVTLARSRKWKLVLLILRRCRNRGGDQRNCVRLSIGISSHNGHRGHNDISICSCFSWKQKKIVQQLQRNLANLIILRGHRHDDSLELKHFHWARGNQRRSSNGLINFAPTISCDFDRR